MGRFEVDRIRRGDEAGAVTALARAFHDDVLFNFLAPHLVRQARGLLTLMSAGLADARPFQEVWVARPEESPIAGAAVWLPPGAYPRGARRDTIKLLRAFPAYLRSARRVPVAVRLMQRVDKAHHKLDVAHFYLAILGVDPAFQRGGAGTALLAPVLARCDDQGVPAYLETQKPENVPWYRRSGFEVVEEITVAPCPPIWTLLRQPR
jgi:GNAT superfamily N-acetyltransferase